MKIDPNAPAERMTIRAEFASRCPLSLHDYVTTVRKFDSNITFQEAIEAHTSECVRWADALIARLNDDQA